MCAGAEASLAGAEQQWGEAMKALHEKMQVSIFFSGQELFGHVQQIQATSPNAS